MLPRPATAAPALPVVAGGLALDVTRAVHETPETPLVLPGPITAADFTLRARAAAAALLRAGVEPGQRVLLMSPTRLEWTVADYAIWKAGAVSVPIDDTLCPDQVRRIVDDADAVAAFTATACQAAQLQEASARLTATWCFDDGALDQLPRARVDEFDEINGRSQSVYDHDVATILYTAGTSRPLTHGNLARKADALRDTLHTLFPERDGAVVINRPLAHIFARLGQIAAIRHRVPLSY